MSKAKKTKATKGKAQPVQDGHEFKARQPAAKGNNIRNWRLFRGIATHHALAAITKAQDPQGKGLDRVSICRLETGELRYNENHIDVLAKALTVSTRDLIGTDPFNAGDIFAVYATASDAEKRRIAKQVAKLKR